MNFISWDNEYRKKIKDMNPGDVFISDSNLWMVSDSDNGVSRFAIKLSDGEFGCFSKDAEFRMCLGKMTIMIGGLD